MDNKELVHGFNFLKSHRWDLWNKQWPIGPSGRRLQQGTVAKWGQMVQGFSPTSPACGALQQWFWQRDRGGDHNVLMQWLKGSCRPPSTAWPTLSLKYTRKELLYHTALRPQGWHRVTPIGLPRGPAALAQTATADMLPHTFRGTSGNGSTGVSEKPHPPTLQKSITTGELSTHKKRPAGRSCRQFCQEAEPWGLQCGTASSRYSFSDFISAWNTKCVLILILIKA